MSEVVKEQFPYSHPDVYVSISVSQGLLSLVKISLTFARLTRTHLRILRRIKLLIKLPFLQPL
jgi:hypothetical protein